MTSVEPASSRLTQFRAALRADGARRALDVLIECAQVVGGWRCLPGGDNPPQELRCVHETSGQELLTLTVAGGGDLVLSLSDAGVALVDGGQPALEAGLGIT